MMRGRQRNGFGRQPSRNEEDHQGEKSHVSDVLTADIEEILWWPFKGGSWPQGTKTASASTFQDGRNSPQVWVLSALQEDLHRPSHNMPITITSIFLSCTNWRQKRVREEESV